MALFSFSPSDGTASVGFKMLLVSTCGLSFSETIAEVSTFFTGVSG